GHSLDWGPLHGDVSLDNVHVFEDGGIAVFDLENCGTGWRSADISAPRQGLVWPHFHAGYRERRTLSAEEVKAAEWFAVPTAIDNLRWHLLVRSGYAGVEFVEQEMSSTTSTCADGRPRFFERRRLAPRGWSCRSGSSTRCNMPDQSTSTRSTCVG